MPRTHAILVIGIALLLAVSGCSGAAPTLPAAAAVPEATPEPTMEAPPQGAAEAPSPEPSVTPALTTAPVSTPEPGGYPAPGTATTRPGYPAPTEPMAQAPPPGDYTPVAPTAPAPTEGLGVVTGTLTRDVRGTPLQPVAEATLYLAEVLRDSEGELSGVAGLDEESAPSTVTDEDGQFAFTGVEPGLYLLIIKTPLSVAPVRDVDAEDVAADVVAGEVTQLGIIRSALAW